MSQQNPGRGNVPSHFFPSQLLPTALCPAGSLQATSKITALTIEFVAKPNETHRVQAGLPAALQSTLGEVAGFAGGFVLIANYETRLVTVVTLWTGENRMQQCSENLKWVRALLNPYMDRCLRIQTLAAFVPATKASAAELLCGKTNEIEDERVSMYAA